MPSEKPKLSTLIDDINDTLISGHEISDDDVEILSARLAECVKRGLRERSKKRPDKTLFMSEVGTGCRRKLWYEYNAERLGIFKEKLTPSTILKFLYGDIVEEIVLFLAEKSGHTVESRQTSRSFDGPDGWSVRGKQDAEIDGVTVDVKSASSYAYKKFESGSLKGDDPFGYETQLRLYEGARRMDGSVSSGAENPAFLAVDKVNGSLCLLEIDGKDADTKSQKLVNDVVASMQKSLPPDRGYKLEEHFTSGLKLGVNCSYCPFKHTCWSDANDGDGLRTFIYSNGPVYMAEVFPGKTPRVTEITEQIKTARKSK